MSEEKQFYPGQKVVDLKYPKRPGGVIRSVSAHAVLVDMTFEDGSIGLSSFKPDVAKAELADAPP